MAVAWTTIPNTDVDVDSPITTALMTALRDNPEGIAQRASGAPKIFGCPYDYQEFTANGTWTKPSNAETGDKVVVQIVGGGGSGAAAGSGAQGGGGGAGGAIVTYDIDDVPSSVTVEVGAGGAAVSSGDGQDGGDSKFTAASFPGSVEATGGEGGLTPTTGGAGGHIRWGNPDGVGYPTDAWFDDFTEFSGGVGGEGLLGTLTSTNVTSIRGRPAVYGGGGGAGNSENNGDFAQGGISLYAGNGGDGSTNNNVGEIDGQFPGGGGGGVDTTASANSGAGADGIVRVWCIKEG